MIDNVELNLLEQIERAKEDLAIAVQHFNYASQEYIEVANEELTIAALNLNLLFKKAKIAM